MAQWVVYLTKGTDARRLLARGLRFFPRWGRVRRDQRLRASTTDAMLQLPGDWPQGFPVQERQRCAKCAAEGHHLCCAQTVPKCVEIFMNRLAELPGSTRHVMNKTLRIMQLNVRKQGAVHDSLMNDEDTPKACSGTGVQGFRRED